MAAIIRNAQITKKNENTTFRMLPAVPLFTPKGTGTRSYRQYTCQMQVEPEQSLISADRTSACTDQLCKNTIPARMS